MLSKVDHSRYQQMICWPQIPADQVAKGTKYPDERQHCRLPISVHTLPSSDCTQYLEEPGPQRLINISDP